MFIFCLYALLELGPLKNTTVRMNLTKRQKNLTYAYIVVVVVGLVVVVVGLVVFC